MHIFVLIFVMVVAIIAGLHERQDYGRCLASETYQSTESTIITMIPIDTQGTMLPVYGSENVTKTRCTRWEFPNGRPSKSN